MQGNKMNILAVTDIHGRKDLFRRILEQTEHPDLLCIGGDLTDFGTVADAEEIVDLAGEFSDRVFAVAGNCDSREIDQMLTDRGISVHGEGEVVEEIGIFGVSAMPIWNNTMYEFTEEEIDVYLKAAHSMVEDCEHKIMISHTPPVRSGVDEIRSGEAVGSSSVRSWVEDSEPDLVLSGHVHEARGKNELEATQVVNCGPAKTGSYARIHFSPPECSVKMCKI